jgi:polyisoprenyl-phosphate glycosyltransferase
MEYKSKSLIEDNMQNGSKQQSALISVVVPLYKEEKNVRPLVERLTAVFAQLNMPWELVFALDPSPDKTEEIILQLINESYPIRLIKFSCRIGKPLSLLAGLDNIAGNACVIIDADLQDPPETIISLVNEWQKGADVIIARRRSRKGEHFFYLKSAELFYWLLDHISEVKVPKNTGDFRLIDAKVVHEICQFRERHAFLRGLNAAVGFKTAIVDYDRDPRLTGKAHISFIGALNIALDGIVPFSRVPVRSVFILGIFLLILGIIGGIISFVVVLLWKLDLSRLLAILLSAFSFLTGILLSALGILGEYIVRAYEETRNRPLYIIDSIIESDILKNNSASIKNKSELWGK